MEIQSAEKRLQMLSLLSQVRTEILAPWFFIASSNSIIVGCSKYMSHDSSISMSIQKSSFSLLIYIRTFFILSGSPGQSKNFSVPARTSTRPLMEGVSSACHLSSTRLSRHLRACSAVPRLESLNDAVRALSGHSFIYSDSALKYLTVR